MYLRHIETLVPAARYAQADLRDAMKAALGTERRSRRLIHRIYSQSDIETRYSVIADLLPGEGDGRFFGADGSLRQPSTRVRNEIYTHEARDMFVEVARRALAHSPGLSEKDISHVITVSCTGFYAPGPDFQVVRDLCLKPSVARFHLGFMGCSAAMPALKMARSFCQADPQAVVLVICLELCSLHLQNSGTLDDLLSGAVFADGAAAAVVSGRPPEGPYLELQHFESALVPGSEGEMAWTIGDSGFEMVLSSYVPQLLESHLKSALKPVWAASSVAPEEVEAWAVHPGGRAILDKVERSLDLGPDELANSRTVLREYGNMSSASILFVLARMLASTRQARGDRICALAFGPGLSVESALMLRR